VAAKSSAEEEKAIQIGEIEIKTEE